MHLTNYSVNKKSKKFQKNDDVDEAAGHKWSLKSLWPELEKLGQVSNIESDNKQKLQNEANHFKKHQAT